MTNPFSYGTVVSGASFCNREAECCELTRAIANGEKVFVISERRMGKTSLVRRVLDQLPARENLAAYVDLWATDTSASFVTATARAITEAVSGTADRILETARAFFSRLTPSVSVDDDGHPRITFGMVSRKDPLPELEEVLEAPAKIAARRGKRVALVFDEFQQILEYGDDMIERRLRSIVQHQENVAYLFLGSRKHLIQEMFMDRSRPLYRIGRHLPLDPIRESEWLPFICSRFEESGKAISQSRAAAVCRLTEGHPFYTQHLCHNLWEICDPGAGVTDDTIDAAISMLLDRENYAYTVVWESLTQNQRRFLKAVACHGPCPRPYGGEFLGLAGLRSPSSAQRAADALIERDLLDMDGNALVIVDRFLRLWVRRRLCDG